MVAVAPGAVQPVPAAAASPRREVQVAVVDGADRVTYSDVRGKKGWQQPLAVGAALEDTRGRAAADRTAPSSPPRVVVTEVVRAELRAVEKKTGPVEKTPSPYQVGKSQAAKTQFGAEKQNTATRNAQSNSASRGRRI